MKGPFKELDGTSSDNSVIFDTAWSPNSSLIACGTIEGQVSLLSLENEDSSLLFSLDAHTDSCRSLDFNVDGTGERLP